MSKNTKGLVIDTRPLGQPGDTYPFAKNGIINNLKGLIENEPGFTLSSVIVPYGTPIGVIETSKFPVIFSTNNVNSAIGYYDADNDTYIPIINDANLPFLLGFSTDFYITGQAQKNYKGDVIVAYTDKNLNPSYLNCDEPNVDSPEDLLLFPLAQAPTLTATLSNGGSLAPGAYFAAIRYLKNDGTLTAFLVSSDPVIVPGAANTVQDYSILISITNVDPNYDIVEIAIVSKINGVWAAVLMDDIQLSPNVTTAYTGANPTTDITFDEVLQNPVVYSKIGTMGQLNDYLYNGNLQVIPQVNMQKYAQLVKVRWVSEMHTVFPQDPVIVTGQKKSFMHREVYALYIQYSLATGGWSSAFHMAGRALTSGDLQVSTQAALGGMTGNPLTFQVEDTIPDFDVATGTGSMGAWQNADETYPNSDDYNASDIGGEDLRGKPVRHHRFPSLRFCKTNLYPYNADYGKASLDILGLQISNVIIPQQYQSAITGYRILYAKRNLGNSTIAGQSLYINCARTADENGVITGGDTNYISTGGNFHSWEIFANTAGNRHLAPDPRLVRFHSFDLLFSQPAITPQYICNELFLQRENLNDNNGFIEDGNIDTSLGPIVYLADYIVAGDSPQPATPDKILRPITSSTYVPNNLVNGNWNNVRQETCFGMVCGGPPVLNPGANRFDPASDYSQSFWRLSHNELLQSDAAHFERTYLTNLMFLRPDLYISFTSQSLVIGCARVNGNLPTSVFGGDTFINDYTFHTYGWQDSVDHTHPTDQSPAGGNRVARRFACEAASNINDRFIIPGNTYSEYYPKQSLVKDDINNYLTLFLRTNDPNQFGYNKDLNTLNELVSQGIFNSLVEEVTVFPFRIHRSGFNAPLDKRRSWRTFDPLDFYEMEKDMGVIINLDGQDDRLIIHCEKALFMTQDKTKLESGPINVTLGSGDIFQFEPQQAENSKLGYAGTQHDLACVRTPVGYLFIDSLQGQLFMYKGTLKLMNEGINTFLRAFARIVDTNIFTGNGYTIGYDPVYKRIVITAKNKVMANGAPVIRNYEATPAFIASLQPGDIVYKDGRLEQFLGINDSPTYGCQPPAQPSMPNYTISVSDDTVIGTTVLTVKGINVDDVYILTGNTSNAWSLAAGTGILQVGGALNYQVIPQYILNCIAINDDGLSVNFTITINIVHVTRPPLTGNQTVHIPEHSAAATAVATVQASDPQGRTLTYAITGGNIGSAFAINGTTGAITVADPTQVDYITNPNFTLQITVSNGILQATGIVTVIVDFVNSPPSTADIVVTIPDTTPTGATIVVLENVVNDQGVAAGLQTLSFAVVAQSIPGVFNVDPTTGTVTLVANAQLNPMTTPQYVIRMQATDNGNPPLSSLFNLIINVTYDPGTIQFSPQGGVCNGGGCAPGYTLSPDGTLCIKTTSTPATPPSGPLIGVGPASNGAYSNFGAVVYQPGYATNGTGTIQTQINSFPWNNPADNSVDGALNRAGIWGTTAVPDNQPIGFSIPLFVPVAKTYYIGVAGDNKMTITVDGVVVVDQDPTAIGASIATQIPAYAGQGIALAFKIWHIYPVTLPAGNHYIGLEGTNFGGAAGVGAEIYDNTILELQSAQLQPAYVADPGTFPLTSNFYSNLNLIFSTRMAQGQFFTSGINNAYSCPSGQGLDPTQTPPQCVLIQTQPAVTSTKHWAQVGIYSTRLATQVALLANTPGQTFQNIPVPTYADVPNHVDCGGTISDYLNVQASAPYIKNDCTVGQLGSVVTYYSQQGKFMSLVSQADADAQATTDVTTNGQTYANTNGYCTP